MLNLTDGTVLVVRAISLVLLFELFSEVPGTISHIQLIGTEYASDPNLWLSIGSKTVLFFILWFLPFTIASIILPRSLGEKEIQSSKGLELERALIGLFGLYLIVWAIPDTFFNLYAISYYRELETDTPQAIEIRAAIISTIVEVVIGFVLLLKAKSIHQLILNLRG